MGRFVVAAWVFDHPGGASLAFRQLWVVVVGASCVVISRFPEVSMIRTVLFLTVEAFGSDFRYSDRVIGMLMLTSFLPRLGCYSVATNCKTMIYPPHPRSSGAGDQSVGILPISSFGAQNLTVSESDMLLVSYSSKAVPEEVHVAVTHA